MGYWAQHALDSWRDALPIGRAFEDRRLHASVGDTFFDIFDKHFSHEFRAAQLCARPLKVKMHRDIVISIDACRGNDIDVSLLGYSLDARDVATKPYNREVYDRIDAARF